MLPPTSFCPSAPSCVAACMLHALESPSEAHGICGPDAGIVGQERAAHGVGWDSENPHDPLRPQPPRAPSGSYGPLRCPALSCTAPQAPCPHALASRVPRENERCKEWTIGRHPSDRGIEGARYRVCLRLRECCAAEARPTFCFQTPQGDPDSDLAMRESV